MSGTASVSFESDHWSELSAVLDRTTEEALELLQVGIARMCECDSDWADVSAHIFAHTLQVSSEYKLDVFAKAMTRKTDKVNLDDEAVLDSERFHFAPLH